MCIYVTFKTEMNRGELEEFKRTWVDDIFNGTPGSIPLTNYIHIAKQTPAIGITVYGNNHIHLGEFKADYGICRNIEGDNCYYPIITFYNQLNKFGTNYDTGQPNNYSIRPREDRDWTNGYITVTGDALLGIVRKSFEYVKIFDECLL